MTTAVPSDPAAARPVVCLGEALIDFVADRVGRLEDCPGFRKAAGGAPANVAVGLARLGVPAAFVGKVGDDPFGRFLERTLRENGVDTAGMVLSPEARTGLAFVSLTAEGERDFVFFRHPSADMLHRPEELPHGLLARAAGIHFGSISLIQDPSRETTLAAVSQVRAAGGWVSFDPNLRLPLWPGPEEARAAILEALPRSGAVKLSEEEAEFLFGPAPHAEQIRRIRDRGPRLVALTRGPGGAVLAAEGAVVEVPGFRVEVVDTTGAGDAFAAALLAALHERVHLDLGAAELAEVGRRACAAGALTCTRKGAIPALPRRSAVDRLLVSRRQQPGRPRGPSA